MNIYTRTLVLPALTLLIPQIGLSTERLDETRDMAADGHVLVENLAGSIEITTWDEAKIEIKGDLGADVEELEISESKNGIHVRVRNKQNERHIEDTDLFLRIPLAASVEVESVSADIDLDGSEGESVLAHSVSGDVEVSASTQRLEIHSVSGDVEFEGAASRSSVETVSGEISLSGLSGEVSISTVSGDVSLIAGEVGRGRFESVSGELKLELSVSDGGRLTGDSMSGDTVLRLPESQQADFTAQTYSGDIQTDFGKAASVSRGPGSALQYKEGSNGASIRLESFSGDIHIRRK